MRCDPGRDRHRAGGRSGADLPAAGHGDAFAGAGGAGPALADSRHQPTRAFRARDAAVGDDVGPRRGAGRHEARRGRGAGDPRRRDQHAAGARSAGRAARAVGKGHFAADGRGRGARRVVLRARRGWSTKSGCCAGPARSAPTAFPRWTHCRCRLSPGRPRFKSVLAKASAKTTLYDLRARCKCSPE